MNPYDYPIEELELGVRAYNILKRMNVYTLGDLAKISVHDLQAWYDKRIASGQHEVAICGATLEDIMDKQRYIATL